MGEVQKDKKSIFFAVDRQTGDHGNQVVSMTTNIEVPSGTNINAIYEFFMKL